MAERTYPRLGVCIKKRKGLCVVCGNPATCWVDVQYSWFRGDDDVAKVCEKHRKDLGAILHATRLEADDGEA